ncbi:MAG: hypothetical protein RL076_1041 [Chloroflexota bacterium]|jgi:uncharacterized membrane protein YczE
MRQFFAPSRTIPHTWWTASSRWDFALPRLGLLIGGLFLFGVGEAFFVQSNQGNSPWAVFASGIANLSGISLEWATFYVSCAVCLLWIPLGERFGIGPIANTIVVAWAMGVGRAFIPLLDSSAYALSIVYIVVGIAFIGLGSALYITCGLGAGPRQGVMAALHRITGVRVGRITTAIEVTVCTAGFLMGGKIGLGTLIFALLVGQSVAIAFGVMGRISDMRTVPAAPGAPNDDYEPGTPIDG